MNEGFRGHLEECLKHLGARFADRFPKGSKGAAEARRPMAEFCGVNIHTATGWLYRSDHLPQGEEYIKVMCFLELNGYRVIESEKLPQRCRNFARLIGYGLIETQAAAEMLSYNATSSLFKVLRGEVGVSAEVEGKLWDFWRARKDKLDDVIEKATVKYRLNFQTGVRQSPVSQAEIPTTTNCPRDGVVDIMQGLLRLLDSGILQNLSDADWDALSNSKSMILRLSSHMSTLSARLVRPV